MGRTTRLASFAVALAVVFGGAWVIGQVAAPEPAAQAGNAGQVDPAGPAGQEGEPQSHDDPAGHGQPAGHVGAEPVSRAAGLASVEGGYRLVTGTTTLPAGGPTEFRFRITGDDGAAVTGYALEHDKLMHLILVRRDGTNYHHLHPELSSDGTWSAPVTLTAAGSYRAFADFRPEGGERTTLGVDVHVPGDFRPVTEPVAGVFAVDGYQVWLTLSDGRVSTIVTRGGATVPDLQPYLGAYGHLVALREGDLAFLHVHPETGAGHAGGHEQLYVAKFPTPGRYRLFLEFRHGDVVRTAEFTLEVPA
ncbi:MAG TPA: hypothetical protein VFM37_06865 [Pseudonocardiaceae bacterium]|nr:hypothetical protein [Pseudonocardiaceae bacterium]